MALLTDDCDLCDATFWMEHGGNGDFYINTMQNEHTHMGKKFQRINIRFAMSGGCISRYPDVAMAIVNLYREMDKAGLNQHPVQDKIDKEKL